MNVNRARPLAAFILVALVCAVVMIEGMRATPFSGVVRASPTPNVSFADQGVVLGSLLRVRTPLDLLSHTPEVVGGLVAVVSGRDVRVAVSTGAGPSSSGSSGSTSGATTWEPTNQPAIGAGEAPSGKAVGSGQGGGQDDKAHPRGKTRGAQGAGHRPGRNADHGKGHAKNQASDHPKSHGRDD